jgi:hypothetical protein
MEEVEARRDTTTASVNYIIRLSVAKMYLIFGFKLS